MRINSLPWFRFYSRFITDPDVEELSFEDQRHFVFLLCLKNNGLLDKEFPTKERRDRAIARRLGLQGEAFEFAKERLVASSLIDDDWQPRSWDALQFKSDSSAERTRRYRAKKSNVTSPQRHRDAVDTDTEEKRDLSKDKSLSRSNGKSNGKGKPPDHVQQVFEHWRQTLKHPKAGLDDKRRRVIRNALKTYSVADLQQAITGCSLTPHNMGHNDRGEKYDTIELILRDASHIDRFMRNAQSPPAAREFVC